MELAFLGIVWVLAAGLLWHGMSLDLWRDDTIGPGAYPVFALAGLLLINTVLIAKALRVRELWIYSPFVPGLLDDTRLHRVAAEMGRQIGIRVRVVTKDGEGRFSALWAGVRGSGAGNALTVVGSDLTTLPNFHAAALCDGRLEPIGGLFFDPDLLVVAAGSPLQDAADLDRMDRRLRLGFGHHEDVDHALDRWLASTQVFTFEATYSEDASILAGALADGGLDAAVLRLSQARQALGTGTLRCIAIFSQPHLHPGADEVSRFGGWEYPVASGHWAALMVPAEMAPAKRAVLETALAGAMADMPTEEGSLRGWSYLPAETMHRVLDIQRASLGRLQEADPALKATGGKIAALVAAIVGLAAFPFVMVQVGFVITAFVYVAALMLMLWPTLTVGRAVLSLVCAAGLSLGTYALFTKVFSILLPASVLIEGIFR
ncbi:tripartite tricarboxylate transporter TctB family protein (plasmid) [Thalassobaculum sp. OXR-137]|uniref:tripartite tricarboxylate transporter TctB family protein n=1 Tax=Thalassobaculum sp. OXR-137 TaxID=3100173 RepID=UPI002AC9178A|nr:tripartite tricarboxylate transporter TctB family protein [Thalassobaculum sp. OXR-137]WPZ37217.1 tripartite tricarboxylate transporter TctB family protein [Thalassobaculum sp. OXR-137]